MAGLQCAARCRRGPNKCCVVWYDNSMASAAARRNSKPRRAVAFDSLEIPSYLNSFLNLTRSSSFSTITVQSGLYLCKATSPSYCVYSQELSYPANNPPRKVKELVISAYEYRSHPLR